MTDGADAQRSHWIPADTRISRESLEKPGFQFLWKLKLDNQAVQLNSLTPAVLIDRYIGYRGFRSLALLAGSSNTIYAIDTDLSRLEWQHRLPLPSPSAGSVVCPGGLTANAARETSAAYPPLEPVGGGLGGRSAPARSDAGEPGQGAVTLAPALAAVAREPMRRTSRPRLPAIVYVVAADGALHALNMSNGEEPGPPVTFLPPGANARGLIVLDGIAYAATGGCNGASSGVWAVDLASKQVSMWEASGGAIAGTAGPAFGPDGTVFATTSAGELVALSHNGLSLMGRYTTGTGGQPFTSSPVVFPYKGKTLAAAATKDGRIYLVDVASLSGPDPQAPVFKTPIYSGGGFAPGALATWQALDGARWVLAAVAGAPAPGSGFSSANGPVTNGAVAAWRVADRDDAISLEPGWLSRDMISPLAPMIINGVVFAVSSCELRSGDNLPVAGRVRKSSPAVLYALDGMTGKAKWDSGRTITSFVHSGGLSGQVGQLYLETFDETLYAFGFPMEH